MEKLLIAVVSCLIGVLIGHRLALGRDRRKEYNEIVTPVKLKLLDHLDHLNDSSLRFMLSQTDIKPLRSVLKDRRYKKVNNAFCAYKSALSAHISTDDYGQPICSIEGYEEISRFAIELNDLLKIK